MTQKTNFMMLIIETMNNKHTTVLIFDEEKPGQP